MRFFPVVHGAGAPRTPAATLHVLLAGSVAAHQRPSPSGCATLRACSDQATTAMAGIIPRAEKSARCPRRGKGRGAEKLVLYLQHRVIRPGTACFVALVPAEIRWTTISKSGRKVFFRGHAQPLAPPAATAVNVCATRGSATCTWRLVQVCPDGGNVIVQRHQRPVRGRLRKHVQTRLPRPVISPAPGAESHRVRDHYWVRRRGDNRRPAPPPSEATKPPDIRLMGSFSKTQKRAR